MLDTQEIDLIPFGILHVVKVRDIKTIKCLHMQNWEKSQPVVILKNGRKLYGIMVVGSGAEQTTDDILREYGRILDGR
ncbi:MAG: hypothetical protein WC878_06730 [Candidatus Paceibacterota bacterium]|jgi:hypothetical protein